MAIGDQKDDQLVDLENIREDTASRTNNVDRVIGTNNVETPVESELSPLQQAVWLGHQDVVQSLLNSGDADVNYSNRFGSALHIACYHGNSSIVVCLLQAGAASNQTGPANQTPVFVAAANGNLEIVQILVQADADVNLCNNEGLSPLHAAVMGGHSEVAHHLLQGGCSANKQDSKGNLPLHYAVRHNKQELVKYLLEAGSRKDSMNKSHESALFLAVYNADINMACLLLNSGCDVNIRKPDGSGLLHCLVSRCNTSQNTCDILETLIVAGCDLNTCAYNTLETPLYRALSLNKTAFAQVLLVHGANPNLSSPFDVTALHLACKNNDLPVINLLLHSGINWKRERWIEQVSYFQTHEDVEIYKLLKAWRNEPMTLVNLSRIILRHHLRENLVCKIGELRAPKSVKNFLLFSGNSYWTTDECSRQYFDKCRRNWLDCWESSELIANSPHPDRKSEQEDVTV